MSTNEYVSYVCAEWDLFIADPSRGDASLDAIRHIEVARVLDVGCGAGQELLPFVRDKKAVGVGIDIAPGAGISGRKLFATSQASANVDFVRGTAEALPFYSHSFDVIICRIALPYTNNRRTLDEISRVLRPGGVLLLKIHHARFYLRELSKSLFSLNVLVVMHDLQVLLAGMVYHVTGRQPRSYLTGKETFQTRWLLQRELRRRGLSIVREMDDSSPAAPSYLISSEKGPEVV